MSDAEDSEDERMKALMSNWERETNDALSSSEDADGEEKDKKKSKKSKKKDKKKKEKKEKDKKEKTKKKDKEKKEKEKDKDKKSKKKDKDKKEKKKKSKDKTPSVPAPIHVAPVVIESDEEDDEGDANSEDARMKELLQAWDNDEDDSDDSSDSDDDDDEEEEGGGENDKTTKAELGLEDNALDHIVLAAPDFDEAMKEFESMTGIKPSIAGSLRGMGTKTARVGLDNNAYIEIVAPDPKNSGPVGAQLMDLEEGSLMPFHFAVRQTDLSAMADNYVPNELGWDPDRIAMFSTKRDGAPSKWEMLFMYGHFMGGAVPFFIDWGECDHPISSIPLVGSLKTFTVRAPGGTKVHELLKGIKDVTMEAGELSLEFSFTSPEGTITFSADHPKGIKFPGYEEKTSGPALDGPAGAGGDDDGSSDDDSDGDSKSESGDDSVDNSDSDDDGGDDDDEEEDAEAEEDEGEESEAEEENSEAEEVESKAEDEVAEVEDGDESDAAEVEVEDAAEDSD